MVDNTSLDYNQEQNIKRYIMLCSYGCNQDAVYQLKNKKWCCSISINKCPGMRKKNSDKLKEITAGKDPWYKKQNLPPPMKGKPAFNKGKTNIEIFGEERAKLIKKNVSNSLKGHSFNISIEHEKIRREKISKTMLKNKRCGGYRKGSGTGKSG